MSLHFAHGDNVTGQLRVTCLDLVIGASDNEWVRASKAAACEMIVEPNGKPPGSIIARFKPVSVVYAGSIQDELGWSAVNVNWVVEPWGDIDFGGGWVPLLPQTPPRWLPFKDTNSATHSWGPTTWAPAGGTRVVQWNTPPGLPPDRAFRLKAGVAILCNVTANDVLVVSFVQANFLLEAVIVQMS